MSRIPLSAFIFLSVLGCVCLGDDATCPEINTCIDELKKAGNTTDPKKLCSIFATGGKCLSNLNNKPECASLKKKLSADELGVTDDQIQIGCEGECGLAMISCIQPVVDEMKPDTVYNLTICQTVAEAVSCMKKKNFNAVCTGNISALVNSVIAHTQALQFSDYCDENGKPSTCFKTLKTCQANVIGLNKNTPVEEACKMEEKYLECESEAQCKNAMEDFKQSTRKQMEAISRANKCPTTGTCDERVQKCVKDLLLKFNGTKPDGEKLAKLCAPLKSTVNCLDFVRKDPVCILKSGVMNQHEQQMRSIEKKACNKNKGARSVIISIGLIFTTSLLTIIKNYV